VLDDEGRQRRLNLFTELRRQFLGYDGRFCGFAESFINDSQTTAEPCEYGLALFYHRSLPFFEFYHDFIFGEYKKAPPGGYAERRQNGPLPRNVQAVRLLGADGSTFVVCHLHGLWLRAGKMDSPERKIQQERLCAFLRRTVHREDKLVLCGDFNLLPESETFRALADEFGLRNLIVEHGINDTRTSFYKKPQRVADYMLVSPNVEVLSFEVPAEPEVSDHRPLILECR
ncbi:MAG TPA: endonuclease/exonuclease/phosphatase family protein, partial [Candidatus Paceibacterota bacterium]|nr:endonuclease/exonuclease/phosphatase family protein [Candidatus Paceibacterota bacterium]